MTICLSPATPANLTSGTGPILVHLGGHQKLADQIAARITRHHPHPKHVLTGDGQLVAAHLIETPAGLTVYDTSRGIQLLHWGCGLTAASRSHGHALYPVVHIIEQAATANLLCLSADGSTLTDLLTEPMTEATSSHPLHGSIWETGEGQLRRHTGWQMWGSETVTVGTGICFNDSLAQYEPADNLVTVRICDVVAVALHCAY